MKSMKQWKEDPIVEEVHRVREKLAEEMGKDPRAFRDRINARAIKSGMQVSELKPISLKKMRDKKARAKKKGS
jgi:hypothetical protein